MPTPVSVRAKRAKDRKRRDEARNNRVAARAVERAAKELVKDLARTYELGPRGTTPQGPRLKKGRKTTTRTRRK